MRRRWYGGVYGWGFSVIDPASGQLSHRPRVHLGLIGFGNAYFLTGDDAYLGPWRKQIELVNSHKKVVDGRELCPHMHGDRGWYAYSSQKYNDGAMELWYWSMRPEDRLRLLSSRKRLAALLRRPQRESYPERALRADFATIRRKVVGMRQDRTTPDTRLADDPMEFNPATVGTLVQLAMGGILPGRTGSILHCRVRHFDPKARRAGLPEDVAALVESMSAGEVRLALVNLDQAGPRTVVVQAGGYAEHRFTSVLHDGREVPVDRPEVAVELAPGAGASLVFRMRRYANPPTLSFPWDRG